MEKVYDNSGVKTRYLTEKLDWYLEEHNWSERNFLLKNALNLLKESIKETIEKTNTKPEKIGAIVLVNSTGISTIDAEIFIFNFNNEIVRLNFWIWVCC